MPREERPDGVGDDLGPAEPRGTAAGHHPELGGVHQARCSLSDRRRTERISVTPHERHRSSDPFEVSFGQRRVGPTPPQAEERLIRSRCRSVNVVSGRLPRRRRSECRLGRKIVSKPSSRSAARRSAVFRRQWVFTDHGRQPLHRHQTTDTRPPTPDHRRQTTDARPPTTRPPTPDHRRQTTDARPPTPDHRHQTTDTRPPTPDHRHQTTAAYGGSETRRRLLEAAHLAVTEQGAARSSPMWPPVPGCRRSATGGVPAFRRSGRVARGARAAHGPNARSGTIAGPRARGPLPDAAGLLAAGWSIETATDLFPAVTLPSPCRHPAGTLPAPWRELTSELGWSDERYVAQMTELLARALLAPAAGTQVGRSDTGH